MLYEGQNVNKDMKEVLVLQEDQSIAWTNDEKWPEVMRLVKVLPGED